jgi:hypothetical protein
LGDRLSCDQSPDRVEDQARHLIVPLDAHHDRLDDSGLDLLRLLAEPYADASLIAAKAGASLDRDNAEVLPLALAAHGDGDRRAGVLADDPNELCRKADRLSVDVQDDVARLDAGLLGGSPGVTRATFGCVSGNTPMSPISNFLPASCQW